MKKPEKEHPKCFGDFERVFPKGADDLRHTPETCLPCRFKTECLRKALKGPCGLAVAEEKVDRAYECGMIGFLERWSQKKHLRSKQKTQKRGCKEKH